MKRVFIVLTAAIVALIGLTVLFKEKRENNTDKPVLTIASRLWSIPEEKRFLLEEILPAFEAQNNCTVNLQVLEDEPLLKRMQVQQETGEVKTDVVVVYASRIPDWVDLVEPLDSFRSNWEDRTFAEEFMGMTTIEGTLRFLPVGADNYLLCANKKALKYLPEDADINSLSWQQFRDWALAVSKAEGEGKVAFTGVTGKMLIYQLSAVILSYGGGFPDLSSDKALAAWEVILSLKPALSPVVHTYDTVVPPMKRGETWLTVTHNARVGEIFTSNPTAFVIAPPPVGPAGRGSVAGVSGLGIMKHAQNRDLAVKFLQYLTRPDIQLQLAKGTGGFVPTVEEALEFPGKSTRDKVIRTSMEVMTNANLAYIPATPQWTSIKLIFDDAFKTLILEQGNIDPSYLKQKQKQVEQHLHATE